MNREQTKTVLKKGLTSFPKYLPVWYRYDKEGSILFDKGVRNLADYYMSSSEVEILKDNCENILNELESPCALVDLGSGSGAKTRILIDAFLRRQKTLEYVPIDISEDFLLETCKTFTKDYGDKLKLRPIAQPYERGIERSGEIETAKLFVWLGSLQCCSYKMQTEYLSQIAGIIKGNDRLLISVDITQDESSVLKAYNDPLGIHNKMYTRSIIRLNDEFDGNIELNNFTTESDFVLNKSKDSLSYHRCWIRSLKQQSCYIRDLNVDLHFTEGERLYLHEGEGNSCKYTIEQIRTLAERSGLHIAKYWTDSGNHVAVVCMEVA